VALSAVLNENETPELAMAASHALGRTRSAQARTALASSPLLRSDVPARQLQAIADLGQQPAPYPANAIATLKELAAGRDQQVAAAAAALLKRLKA
jgi:hypothetical protein